MVVRRARPGERERLSARAGGAPLALYDLHFLRQIGANAASLSKHLDIHDTGDAATSRISAAVVVLVGGWRL